jgi:hypothetical protein
MKGSESSAVCEGEDMQEKDWKRQKEKHVETKT